MIFQQLRRDGLALEFVELGLAIEQIHMRWPAGHKKKDDPPGLRGEMRLAEDAACCKHLRLEQ